MVKGVNYEITLSSPLMNLFPGSENMESMDPPIHIDIKDSKTSKAVYARQEANRNKQSIKASNKLILQDRG